ncbi:site-2 protease family protein [Allostreptomyces psammosilenae]|uniref:Zinc metalloprotease n=1 Tax=Allostreptomyces psammosilenae TaxID=1892865 RepID=A0A852ZRS4_9ACTN|nr:site-2 protease family protein [Allostreptomyces psammosilenae]NYI03980.1 Zn-dependent protease [Allostreptomyces psammosilenae]
MTEASGGDSRPNGRPDKPGRGTPPGASGDPTRPFGAILLGRPFRVPVYVAPSWFLVALLIAYVFGGQIEQAMPELGALSYLIGAFFAVAFYASVLVHELAHTVVALRYGLPVRRIRLQFLGGASEIEREADAPGREFLLSGAGPALSVVLTGLFWLAAQAVTAGTVPYALLTALMAANLIVSVFNLLPGLPLDGGRMLAAVVWWITGNRMTGTVAAAWIGRLLAVAVVVAVPAIGSATGAARESDLFTVDVLIAVILGVVLWSGSDGALRRARLRENLPRLTARALTRRAEPVATDLPLAEALRRAEQARAGALVVVDADGAPTALVSEAAIGEVPEHRRPWVAVGTLAQPLEPAMRVPAELAGEELLAALRARPSSEYLVVEPGGGFYGVLSVLDVNRAFRAAMARPRR